MPNNGTQFFPPATNVQNVLYGTAYLWTAANGTALPADINLGDQSFWTSGGWGFVGSTEQGVQNAFNPNMSEIQIEEQPTPVASLVATATFQITTSMSEETLTNVNLAYGGGGTIVNTAQGTGQPAKSVLSLSSVFGNLACAIMGKNNLGFPRIYYVPKIQSAGQVTTTFRRAANARLYPLTLNALCDLSQIQVIDITAAGL